MIAQAKGLFSLALVIIAVVLGVVIWNVMEWHHGGADDVMRATIESQKERIEKIQDSVKDSGAQPTGLRLTPIQRGCLVNQMRDARGLFSGLFVFSFPEKRYETYAQDFILVFVRVGLVTAMLPAGTSSINDKGLMIGLRDLNNPSDNAKKFMGFIGACGLSFKTVIWEHPEKIPFVPDLKDVDFNLFIGPDD